MAVVLQESKIKIKPFFSFHFYFALRGSDGCQHVGLAKPVERFVWDEIVFNRIGTLDKSAVIPWLSNVTRSRRHFDQSLGGFHILCC